MTWYVSYQMPTSGFRQPTSRFQVFQRRMVWRADGTVLGEALLNALQLLAQQNISIKLLDQAEPAEPSPPGPA